MSIFVLVMEFVGVRHRSMMGSAIWYCWTLSLISLAGVAYLIRDWKILSIVAAVPGITAVFGYL